MYQYNSPAYILANGIYLFQYLTKRGFNVELIQLFSLATEKIIRSLQEDHLAAIISTTFLTSAKHIDEIGNFIKIHSPKTMVIAGGVKIWKSFLTMKQLKNDEVQDEIDEQIKADTYFIDKNAKSPVDIFINNDRGEHTLANLLKKLQAKKSFNNMKNLAFFKNGKYIFNNRYYIE